MDKYKFQSREEAFKHVKMREDYEIYKDNSVFENGC